MSGFRVFKFAIILGVAAPAIVLSAPVSAANFCVSNVTELQDALSTAEANGEDDTIRVVQGTYNSNFNYSSDQGNDIAVLGGYASGCNDREISPANTILDADGSYTVLSFYLSNGGNITVEGLTIRNGSSDYAGGGVIALSSAESGAAGNITISSNVITGNHTNTKGGGVFAYSLSNSSSAGDVILADNIITANNAGEGSGGAYAGSQSDPGLGGSVTLTNNTFSDNTSNWGHSGARANTHSKTGTAGTVILTGNIFSGNSASSESSFGGGVWAKSYSVSGAASLVTITNNTITGNTSNQDVGGIAAESMGPVQSGDVILSGNMIIGNAATRGYGGLFARSATSTGNSGDVVLVNNIIAQNSAGEDTGGAQVSSTSASGTAGAVTLTNNTIAENSAGLVGGGAVLHMDDNTLNCYNNIIRGNTASSGVDIYLNGTGSANGYNNNYSSLSGNWANEGGNIDVDPGFVNALNGDYHLRPSSQCIDQGDNNAPGLPAFDCEGDPRIIDGNNNGTPTVDMGADEYLRKMKAMPYIPLLLLAH